MEIPEISMISNFQAGMNCLKNPSLVSRFIPLSGIEKVPQVYSFWKWGAVILAILATFSSLIKRVKLLIIHIRKIKPSPESLLQHLDLDLDLDLTDDSDDDEGDDGGDDCQSSVYSSDDEATTSFLYQSPGGNYEDFCVKGSGNFFRNQWQNANLNLRRRILGDRNGLELNWTDFPAGKNVVKLWDSLGLSLNFDPFEDSDSETVVSLWDFNKEQKVSDIFSSGPHFPAVSTAAPTRSVVLSATKNEKTNNGVILGAYDTRMKGHVPASYAEWSQQHSTSPAKNNVISGGNDKVYIRDDKDARGVLTVGDLRKLNNPLETLRETTTAEGEANDDAAAIIDDNEFVDCSP